MRKNQYDPDNPLNFTNATQVKFYIVGTLGATVFILTIIAAIVIVPGSSFLAYVATPLVLSIAAMLIALKILLRGHHTSGPPKRDEIRKMLHAEREKQMDQMLRSNSNIPNVERDE